MNVSIHVKAIETRIFNFNENIYNFIAQHLKPGDLSEKMIVVITSKILSLAEGRRVPTHQFSKEEIVKKEADHYLGSIGYGCHLTIKHGLLIPSAGIDESNSDGSYYILFPEDPFESARKIHAFLKEKFGLKNIGVLVTDSHTMPLRRGVTGIALSYWGFKGVQNYVGREDLFGRNLKMTQVDYADALAASSVLMMGEANERRPLALISCDSVEFCESCDVNELKIPLAEDLYSPLLKKL